jgi:hypothetical protein
MRKLIVLIMTSVLATGAVANADDVNVVEDPGNVISILQALEGTEADARAGSPANATTLTPGLGSSRDKYTFRGEALQTVDAASLEKVAVCFFDTRVADDSTKVDNLCGYGSAGGDLATTKALVGSDNPESALQASFETSDLTTFNNDNTNLHTTGTGGDSVASVETTFKGLAATNAVHFGVTVQLSHAMAAGTGAYKIRVVAIYSDNSLFELTDTGTYSVANYFSMQTQRDAINFGDVFRSDADFSANEPATNTRRVSDINAGSYYANVPAKFTIEATEFQIGADANTAVSFQEQANGKVADNSIELYCDDSADAKSYTGKGIWVGTAAQEMFGWSANDAPGIPASNTETDPESTRELSNDMRCEISIGSLVPFGQYSNTVTMAIDAY